jgi:hypothetical protein
MNPRHQLPMTQTQTKESFTATKKKSNEILKEFERVIRKRMRGELKGVNVKRSLDGSNEKPTLNASIERKSLKRL